LKRKAGDARFQTGNGGDPGTDPSPLISCVSRLLRNCFNPRKCTKLRLDFGARHWRWGHRRARSARPCLQKARNFSPSRPPGNSHVSFLASVGRNSPTNSLAAAPLLGGKGGTESKLETPRNRQSRPPSCPGLGARFAPPPPKAVKPRTRSSTRLDARFEFAPVPERIRETQTAPVPERFRFPF